MDNFNKEKIHKVFLLIKVFAKVRGMSFSK